MRFVICVMGVMGLVVVGVRVARAITPLKFTPGDVVRLNIQVRELKKIESEGWGVMHRGVFAKLPKGVNLDIGDRLKLTGKVEPRVIGERQWQIISNYSDFEIEEPNKGLFTGIKYSLVRWLPGNAGALAAGIVFGDDSGLGKKVSEQFRASGLSHVVAASGYNVTVVAGAAMAIFNQLVGRKRAIYFGILSSILYVFMAGATAAVVRAGVMAGITLVGLYMGKKADGVRSLVVSMWLMLMLRPEWAIDIGFQLSVAATVGLILAGGRDSVWWKTDLKTAVLAQAMTAPIILHYFGNISMWAPITNVLVLWAVPVIMEISGIAVLLGVIWDGLGMVVVFLAWPLLEYMLAIVGWTASWPGNGLWVEKISWGWVMGYYLALGGGYLIKITRSRK